MGNILGFLEEPADVARLCYFTSRCLRQSSAPLCGPQWEQMYIDRWPALYQAQKYLSGLSHLDVDWKSMLLGIQLVTRASLLVAPGITTRNKKLLVTKTVSMPLLHS